MTDQLIRQHDHDHQDHEDHEDHQDRETHEAGDYAGIDLRPLGFPNDIEEHDHHVTGFRHGGNLAPRGVTGGL